MTPDLSSISRRVLLACIAGLLVAAVAVAWWMGHADGTAAPERPAATPADRPDSPVPVVLAPARRVQDIEVVEAMGTARAVRTARLQPAAAGEVAEVRFRAGDAVRAGQVLLRLDEHRERLALRMAEATEAAARRLVRRHDRMAGTGALPAHVIDEARTALEQAEIATAQARQALADRRLRAPFDGIVGLAAVQAGDRVTTETVIGTLDDRRRLLVDFDLAEIHLPEVATGDTVRARTVAYAGRDFDGRIAQIDSRVDEASRAVRVRAEVPNAEDLLRPGLSFRVRLSLPHGERLKVPELALQWDREGAHVWTAREGRAERVPVTPVRRLEGSVLIDAPLRDGDAVVVEGVQRLRAGRALRSMEPAP